MFKVLALKLENMEIFKKEKLIEIAIVPRNGNQETWYLIAGEDF